MNSLFEDALTADNAQQFDAVFKHVKTEEQLNSRMLYRSLPIQFAIGRLRQHEAPEKECVESHVVHAILDHPQFNPFTEHEGKNALDTAVLYGQQALARKILQKQEVSLTNAQFGKLWPLLQIANHLEPADKAFLKVWINSQSGESPFDFTQLRPLFEKAVKAHLETMSQ